MKINWLKFTLSDAEYTEGEEVTTEEGSKVKVAVKRTVKDLFNNPSGVKKLSTFSMDVITITYWRVSILTDYLGI